MRPGILSLVTLLGACASGPRCDDLPSGKVLRDPNKLLPTFQAYIRCGEYAKAHKCLSRAAKEAVPYEAFYATLTAFEATARLIDGLREHSIDRPKGLMRICNPEFGISRDFRIRGEFGGRIWTFDFTRADLEYFQDRARRWFRRQVETAGGRFHVYPPDWTYSRVIPKCGCKKDG